MKFDPVNLGRLCLWLGIHRGESCFILLVHSLHKQQASCLANVSISHAFPQMSTDFATQSQYYTTHPISSNYTDQYLGAIFVASGLAIMIILSKFWSCSQQLSALYKFLSKENYSLPHVKFHLLNIKILGLNPLN